MAYERIKDKDKSLTYFRKAIAVAKADKNMHDYERGVSLIGVYYTDIGNTDSALYYLNQGLAIEKSRNNQLGVAQSLGNIGNVYKKIHDFNTAIICYEKALKIFQEFDNTLAIAYSYANIGELYFMSGKYVKAKEYAVKAMNLAPQLGDLQLFTAGAGVLYQIYLKLGMNDSASKYIEMHLRYRDSTYNAEKIQEIGRMTAKFEYDREKEEQRINIEQEAQKRKLTNYLIGATFIIVLMGTGFIYYRFRAKAKLSRKLFERNEEITAQKEEISSQRDELIAQSEQISQQRDQLEQTNAQLKALDEFKEAMSNMIVHDLKNPLNTIIGLSGRNNLGEHDQLMIHQAGKQMLNLTLNILDVQKFEQTDMPLNLKDYPLADIASDAVRQINLLASNKNLKLIVEINVKTGVYADFELISRVFMNLLTNAIKFTPNNGKITISAEKTDHQITVAVSDTGHGIPADKLHTVFDKFSQVEAKKSGIVHSTGLGLTFCKMVVEAHGGRIWVTSKVNEGTTFYFNLPEALTQVMATEQPVEMIKETLELTDADKNALAEYLPALQALDVYEGSEVLQILASITGSPAVNGWKNEIENAIFSSNQERYEELVNLDAV